jgi:hypothetical protein
MNNKIDPECSCEGLFKKLYFEAIDNNHELRVKNENLRNDIDRYEETLEIMNNPEIMEQINLAKAGKIKGIPLKELAVNAVNKEVKKDE